MQPGPACACNTVFLVRSLGTMTCNRAHAYQLPAALLGVTCRLDLLVHALMVFLVVRLPGTAPHQVEPAQRSLATLPTATCNLDLIAHAMTALPAISHGQAQRQVARVLPLRATSLTATWRPGLLVHATRGL